ncbi:MAG: hypothetical protein V1914_02545 [archaeon]
MNTSNVTYMQKKSAADKLYDLITVSPAMGNERIKTFWNLESRVYSIDKFLSLIGTLQDKNPTANTDLETLIKCVEKLEEKSKSPHWQKVYSNENRKLKETYVKNTIRSLKSYIGIEARKNGKNYNRLENKIENQYKNYFPEQMACA